MNEAKPFASLSSSLLARKGHAKPAMRPQSFHMVPGPAPASDIDSFRPDHDDLGWNDMGHELNGHELNGAAAPVLPINRDVAAPVEEAPTPPVVEQQEMLAREFPEPVETPYRASVVSIVQAPKLRAAPGSKAKAAFTLRLDSERHFRLRLVCAVHHRSAQQIVTLALDEYLSRQPDNAALAAGSAN